jgi:hypothetical protein
MSDMAFTAVAKVYAGLSARRFDSDVRGATAKGLTDQDPHFNSVLRYLRSPEMTPVLKGLVELSALPLKGVETDFAADSTGFSTCRFARWYDEKWGHEKTKREWIKLHAMTGVRTLPPYPGTNCASRSPERSLTSLRLPSARKAKSDLMRAPFVDDALNDFARRSPGRGTSPDTSPRDARDVANFVTR